jgi:hypothetical protein
MIELLLLPVVRERHGGDYFQEKSLHHPKSQNKCQNTSPVLIPKSSYTSKQTTDL